MVMINHDFEEDPAAVPPTLRNVEKLILKPYCQTLWLHRRYGRRG